MIPKIKEGPSLPEASVNSIPSIPPSVSRKRTFFQTTNGSRRLPCKARGLSNSHTAETAYFEIPNNAPHGLLLCCTHPECINAPRRFRFCKVCALPVAKRNFLRRHGHGLIKSSKECCNEIEDESITANSSGAITSASSSQNQDEESNASSKPDNLQTTEHENCHRRQVSLSSRSAQQPQHKRHHHEVQHQVQEHVQHQQSVLEPPRVHSGSAPRPTHRAAMPSELNEASSSPPRPTHRAAMPSELTEAASVSKSATFRLTASERDWIKLLRSRPDPNDESRTEDWMDRVLTYSAEELLQAQKSQLMDQKQDSHHQRQWSIVSSNDTALEQYRKQSLDENQLAPAHYPGRYEYFENRIARDGGASGYHPFHPQGNEGGFATSSNYEDHARLAGWYPSREHGDRPPHYHTQNVGQSQHPDVKPSSPHPSFPDQENRDQHPFPTSSPVSRPHRLPEHEFYNATFLNPELKSPTVPRTFDESTQITSSEFAAAVKDVDFSSIFD